MLQSKLQWLLGAFLITLIFDQLDFSAFDNKKVVLYNISKDSIFIFCYKMCFKHRFILFISFYDFNKTTIYLFY